MASLPKRFNSWDEYDAYMKRTGPWLRPSYINPLTEFVATNPVTKFLVPGAEQFLQRGQKPSLFDVGMGLVDVGLPGIPVAAGAKKFLRSRGGKTREEIKIQGGPLDTRLNEQEVAEILDSHGMDWEYHENGGVRVKDWFRDLSTLKFRYRWKHFRDGTKLRTIRNWLGY